MPRTLLFDSRFRQKFTELRAMDPPAARVVRDLLLKVQQSPSEGPLLLDLTQSTNIYLRECSRAFASLLGTIPLELVRCYCATVLADDSVVPTQQTLAIIPYVAHGQVAHSCNLRLYFPNAQASDIAAVLYTNIWLRGNWLLNDRE